MLNLGVICHAMAKPVVIDVTDIRESKKQDTWFLPMTLANVDSFSAIIPPSGSAVIT